MEDLGLSRYPLFQDTSKWIHENVSLIQLMFHWSLFLRTGLQDLLQTLTIGGDASWRWDGDVSLLVYKPKTINQP